MNHITPALLLQLILSPFGWWIGAAAATAYYLGREMAQAEYRVIQTYYAGKRANMPWYGAFEGRAWDRKSLLDWLLPTIFVVLTAAVLS